MDFEFTEEQKMLQTTIRDFLEKEIAPIVDERDRQGSFSREEVIGYIKKMMPKNTASEKTCPAAWLVASMFLSPKRREVRAPIPTPVPTPMAMISMW